MIINQIAAAGGGGYSNFEVLVCGTYYQGDTYEYAIEDNCGYIFTSSYGDSVLAALHVIVVNKEIVFQNSNTYVTAYISGDKLVIRNYRYSGGYLYVTKMTGGDVEPVSFEYVHSSYGAAVIPGLIGKTNFVMVPKGGGAVISGTAIMQASMINGVSSVCVSSQGINPALTFDNTTGKVTVSGYTFTWTTWIVTAW